MVRDMGDLEKGLTDMDAAAPADLRVHPMGSRAITRIGAKLNRVLMWSVYHYWLLMVVSALSLTNLLLPKNQVLMTPTLTLIISVFMAFLAAICLMLRSVISRAPAG